MPIKDKKLLKEYNQKYYADKVAGILVQKKVYHAKNKKIISKKQADYRKTERGRFAHTRCAKYISYEEYVEMKNRQNNLCAICGNKCSSGKELCIDHCHKTNKVRGLLCINCNFGISKFKDNVDLLENAIAYLKNQ